MNISFTLNSTRTALTVLIFFQTPNQMLYELINPTGFGLTIKVKVRRHRRLCRVNCEIVNYTAADYGEPDRCIIKTREKPKSRFIMELKRNTIVNPLN